MVIVRTAGSVTGLSREVHDSGYQFDRRLIVVGEAVPDLCDSVPIEKLLCYDRSVDYIDGSATLFDSP